MSGRSKQQEDENVRLVHFYSRESVQKQILFKEKHSQIQEQGQVLGAARVRRGPVSTPTDRPEKKIGGPVKESTRQKSAIQAIDKRTERYDLQDNLGRKTAGIKFEQKENGNVDKVRKES